MRRPTAQLPVKHRPRSARRRDHRRADLAGAGDDVEHARRQLRGVRGLGVALAAQRRDVARLDDDRVAGEQRGDDVRVAQVQREVERPDHADHAERLVAQVLAGRDRARLEIAGHRALHQIEAVEQRLDLVLRLAADLAGLEHDRVGELRRRARRSRP